MHRILPLVLAVSGCDALLRLAPVPDIDARVIDAAPAGLVAYYPFENAECATDVVGHHDGLCPVGVPPRAAGPNGHGMAAMFDGVDYVTVPHAMVLDPMAGFTIAAWLAPDQFDRDGVTYSCIVNRPYGVTGADSWQICGRGIDTLWGFADQFFMTTPLVTGTWTHVALTWDGQTMTAWVNGAPLSPAMAGQPIYDAQPIWFGADNDGAGPAETYIGSIDEIQLYSRALSGDEIIVLAQ